MAGPSAIGCWLGASALAFSACADEAPRTPEVVADAASPDGSDSKDASWGGRGSTEGDASALGGRGGSSGLPDFSDIRCEPTLTSIQDNVFARACGYDSCHGDNNAAWGLVLTLSDVESQLVRAPARACGGYTRVVPGAPEQSLLWLKISEGDPGCGERMPLALGPLPDSALTCVYDWIASLPRGVPDAAPEGGPSARPTPATGRQDAAAEGGAPPDAGR